MTAQRHESRPRLRDYREARGLTQQQVVDELTRLAWLRNGQRVGVNADMVSKWERGDKRPSPLYRDLFSMLFRATPAELGLAPAPVSATALEPHARRPDDGDPLTGAMALLDELGDAGVLIQPHMFAIVKDELVNRRSMLKLLGVAPLAAMLPGDDRGSAALVSAQLATTLANVEQSEALAMRY